MIMGDEKKFFNYEHNYIIYRSKTAMCVGSVYFNKGYQSSPVLALQFANVNPETENEQGANKTFNWSETNSYWFTTYDQIHNFYTKLVKWKNVIDYMKKNKLTDSNEIRDKFSGIADKNKISNPAKKTTVYMMPKFYNGVYYLGISYSSEKITVSITEDELDGMILYVGGYIQNYHQLLIMHRFMRFVMSSVDSGGSTSNNDGDSRSFDRGTRNQNSNNQQRQQKKQEAPPDDFGSPSDDDMSFDTSEILGDLDGFNDNI